MIFMSKVKTILGGLSAIGLALGGLVAAGKSGFGKNLGVKPEPEFDDDDLFCEEAIPVEPETKPDDEEVTEE
jgi:hypothetical protein